MDDKLKYIFKYTKSKKRKPPKNFTLGSSFHKQLGRYNSAIFEMKNKKIVGLKDQLPIKNIEFEAPKNDYTPLKIERSKNSNFRNRLMHLNKSNLSLNKNRVIKNISVFQKVKSKNILIKNKIIQPFIATIYNNIYDIDKKAYPNSFSMSNFKKQNNLQNIINCSNKNSQTENIDSLLKPEVKSVKKEINPILYKEYKEEELKDRVPLSYLKKFHSKLFKSNKKFHKRKIESNDDEKVCNSKITSESCGTSQINDNISIKYEMMEFNNKIKYIASELHRRKKDSPFYVIKPKEKLDFHYIMKHPFSNNYFCSSFVNHMTYCNNSYINDYSEKFQNLNNPMNDNDLIKKLHNLILNPNTSKIRNGQLLLMYKNYPKGTFYGNKNNIDNNTLIDNELKKLENSKYKNIVVKLNQTMRKVKEMQKELDDELYINKKNL